MASTDDTITFTGAERSWRRGAILTSEPALYLVFQCDQLSVGSSRHSLAGVAEVQLGRGAERGATRTPAEDGAVLQITVNDRRMSSRHARLLRQPTGAWSIEDLGSKNGTLVAGSAARRPLVLRDGDLIEAGATFFIYRAAEPTSDQVPPDADEPFSPTPMPGLQSMMPRLAQLFDDLARVAAADSPVALLGETGTGKEVVGRALHAIAGRVGPFMAVNCGALPPGLVESELFGHKKGAFSGAVDDRVGLVRAAHGGTLFLDEIGDLPLPAQASLLRVIEQREILPVGARRAERVDVRILSATHRDLDAMVRRGEFRQDLWARLSAFVAHLPPLRARREDLGLLVNAILRRQAPARADELSIDREMARVFLRYAFPNNIRELVNALNAALVLSCDGVLSAKHLPEAMTSVTPTEALVRRPAAPPLPRRLRSPDDDKRREQLVQALTKHRGNVKAAAMTLGHPRQVVYRWLERYGVDPDDYRD
jgi:DNA-binding NtrC family response regulator